MTATNIVSAYSFLLMFLVLSGVAHSITGADENLLAAGSSGNRQGPFQMDSEAVARGRGPTGQVIMSLLPGHPIPVVARRTEYVTKGADEPVPDNKGDDVSLSAEVREIADRLATEDSPKDEDNEEVPIRDAFVHGPDELDDLAVPVAFKDAVDYYIAYFTIRKRRMFASWLHRAKRYTPRLKEILREHDLPEDLVYLAMIESGFNPKAYSRAKACGPWQFISATGARYGLRIDHWVDERRDFEKATIAAALYLKDLFDRFGCWYLAASGYNAGEGRVERAIKRHNTSDYWQIYRYNTLPRETRHYIPQLIAAATISENPEKYGFAEMALDQVPEYGYCVRKVPPGTPLRLVAEASSTELSHIRSLNPELLTGITPPGDKPYALKLPEDAPLDLFGETLSAQLAGKRVVRTVRLLLPRRRQALTRLLKRFGTTRNQLALVNPNGLSRGRHIYVPVFDRELATEENRAAPRLTSYKSKRRSVRASKANKSSSGLKTNRPTARSVRRSRVAITKNDAPRIRATSHKSRAKIVRTKKSGPKPRAR